MEALDPIIVAKDTRVQALGLLNSLVRYQPPHLYQVTETSIITHLIKCLLIDTSTVAVSLALNTLIMFLPHIPSSVRKHLTHLFLIYSRILLWERNRKSSIDQSEDEKTRSLEQIAAEDDEDDLEDDLTDTKPKKSDPWDKLESPFDIAEAVIPELTHYFTFLYGLYPLNFMSYCRNQRKYFTRIGFKHADASDLDKALIRARTAQYSRLHILNPAFFTTTIEDELEENRWLKTDPADVVAECMGLCLAIPVDLEEDLREHAIKPLEASQELSNPDVEPLTLPANPWRNPRYESGTSGISHIEPLALMRRGSVQQNKPTSAVTTSSIVSSPRVRARDDYEDSPTLPPVSASHELRRVSRSQMRDSSIASTHRSLLTQSPRLDALSAPSRNESSRSPALRPVPEPTADMTFLQREVLLLRNDLNFERYLKQQHLAHIGQLQRRNIREATMEAETHNLINNTRILQDRLARLKKSHESLQKDVKKRSDLSKRLEADLTVKLKTLKEEATRWHSDEERLRTDLRKAQTDVDTLRHLVVSAESRELLSKQELSSSALQLEQLATLQTRIATLEAEIHTYAAAELSHEHTLSDLSTARASLTTTQMRLAARDNDFARSLTLHTARITDLEAQLLAAQNPTIALDGTAHIPGQLAPAAQHMIDVALAGLNNKYGKLKREYARLRQHTADLEQRNREMEAEVANFATSPFGPSSMIAAGQGVPIPSTGPRHGQAHGHGHNGRSYSHRPSRPDSSATSFFGTSLGSTHGSTHGTSAPSAAGFATSPQSFSSRSLALSRTISPEMLRRAAPGGRGGGESARSSTSQGRPPPLLHTTTSPPTFGPGPTSPLKGSAVMPLAGPSSSAYEDAGSGKGKASFPALGRKRRKKRRNTRTRTMKVGRKRIKTGLRGGVWVDFWGLGGSYE